MGFHLLDPKVERCGINLCVVCIHREPGEQDALI
jgi:hypothetical protein